MSRRKQAKPQHINSDEQQPPDVANGSLQDAPGDGDGEMSSKRCRTEETNICEKCCAEFFDLSEFLEHKKNCTKTPPVLIMSEGEGTMPLEDFPDSSSGGFPNNRLDNRTAKESHAKSSSVEKRDDRTSSEPAGGVFLKTEPPVGQAAHGLSYLPKPKVPNTNVTLQTIRGTKVAVNQCTSETLSPSAAGLNAIPMILEQLVCLQQQQLQQIQLTEQIRIQIAMMAPHVLHPSIAAAADPLKALGAHMSQQLSAAVALIGQKAGNQSLSLESLKQGKLPHPTLGIPASVSLAGGLAPSLSLKPEASKGLPGSIMSRFQSPLLPQSSSSVIFQSPLSAVSSAVDPAKKGKGKLPNVNVPEPKPTAEEALFKYKCKFCGKVFGNDSALQIHLRSHTGERPYKCNICGNRFTTKGNLKVHFQRHKDRYPHIKMNQYSVPEHLDNVPTSSGIPYGMSLPLDESNLIVDTKPILTSLPTSVGAGSSQNTSSVASTKDSFSGVLLNDMQPGPSPESEGGSSSGATSQESGIEQNRSSPQAGCSMSAFHIGRAGEQGSETTKLQQLVENIDKSTADPNECLICHRVLSCQSSLKMHYRTHTGERPFKCKICGRAFSTKGNLKTHYGVHRANTPLKMQHSCPICQKKFTNAVVLQQHIRMHMGGQIPNTPVPENARDSTSVEAATITEKNGDPCCPDETVEGMETEGGLELQDGPSHSSKSPTPGNAQPDPSSSVFSSISVLENQMKMVNSALTLQRQSSLKSSDNGSAESDGMTNDSSSVAGDPDYQNGSRSPVASESASFPALSPATSQTESTRSKSPGFNIQEDGVVGSKPEGPEIHPTERESALDLTYGNIGRKVIKEEPGLHFPNGEYGRSSVHAAFVRAPPTLIKMEIPSDRPISASHFIGPPALSPGVPLLVPPPRRTAKQHICTTCGKNFSSASALQIHERTHTGEKPFACSICGRAFTTKGNLKVHVGTHMWSNSARRGRRLSIDNPMALLSSDPKKVSEMFPKDVLPPPVNLDPSAWNQYAAVLSNGLAMKTNEISVIQSGGIPSLPTTIGGGPAINIAMNSATVSKLDGSQSAIGSDMEKSNSTAVDNVPKRQFPHFMEENKIAVN